MTTAREYHLRAYPEGAPTADIFQLVERELPDPAEGEVEVEVTHLSVDPYMRGRMRPGVESYIPPFQLNEALDGGAVGRVVKSRSGSLKEGDRVVANSGGLGWRDRAVVAAKGLTPLPDLPVPDSAYLGVLGMPGLTAWAGLTQIIAPRDGDVLYVSGAAGAVGSLVCQLGLQRGLTVLGSAGSQAKRDWLEGEIGIAKAFDYRAYDARSLSSAIREIAPGGVNGYFENVGGMQLEALIDAMAGRGRIAACGMIADYNATTPPPGPRNMVMIVGKQLRIEGFIVTRFESLQGEFFAEVAPLVAAGKVVMRETVFSGLESAPEAFMGLFKGANTGKAVVEVRV